ncbi:MAG: AAA family ATPase [Bacteroidota bacterium]
MLPRLPIGQQYFRGIREEGSLYIDKTEHIYNLIRSSKYFFLARPRRFGKSLTLSVISELFQGSQELFKGLWIEDKWDWEQTNPVVHIQFNEINYKDQPLEVALRRALLQQYKRHNIEPQGEVVSDLFGDLLQELSDKKGRVVLLIDEYDKPLIDYLTKDKIEQGLAHQAQLKSFYSVIESSDTYLKFVLITGVSKFSKVGVFSDLNNLLDITFHRLGENLVGISQEELETHFGAAIDHREKETGQTGIRDRIKMWYNGYSFFDGQVKLYNPFSILSFFSAWEFQNFWFSTGTPTFLVNLLRERNYYRFDRASVGQSGFESYQIDQLETVPLLYQTGYLTIKNYDRELLVYDLDYPNREVKDSMLQHLIAAFSRGNIFESAPTVVKLRSAFLTNDLEKVVEIINNLFQSIPHQLFIEAKENLYHALIHLLFTYLGQYIQSEVSVLRGRIDSVVQTDSHVYIIEFKLDQSAQAALDQIQEKDYMAPYRESGKEIVALGINFNSEQKRIDGWLTA